MNRIKRIISIFLIITLVCSSSKLVKVKADVEGYSWVSLGSSIDNHYIYHDVYFFIQDGVAAYQSQLEYDQDVLKFEKYDVGSLFSSALTSVNADEAGIIRIGMVSGSDIIPGNNTVSFIRLYFSVKETEQTSTEIAYRESVFTNLYGDSYPLYEQTYGVSVYEARTTVYLGTYGNQWEYDANGEITVALRMRGNKGFSAYQGIVTYDNEKLCYKKYEKQLNNSNVMIDVQDDGKGSLHIAIVSPEDIRVSDDILHLTFDILGGVEGYSEISHHVQQLNDSQLNDFNLNGVEDSGVSFNIRYKDVENLFSVSLPGKATQNEEFSMKVALSSNTGIGAIDLLAEYDPEKYEMISVTAGEVLKEALMVSSDKGGQIVIGIIQDHNITGNGEFLNIAFKAKQAVEEMSDLDFSVKSIVNESLQEQKYTIKRILPADISDAVVETISDQYYTGEEIQPALVVNYNGTQLEKGTDYTIRYSNNINAGEATVYIQGIGKYMGTREQTFKIKAVDISGAEVTGIEDRYYTGEEIKPEPVVKYNGTQLVKGTDYTVSYENNVSEGTASVIVTGKGNYAGKQTKNFRIAKEEVIDISAEGVVTIRNFTDRTYDGKEQTQEIKVTLSENGTELQADTDYTVQYSNNINAGEATVYIQGIGKYMGTREQTFKINAADISEVEVTGIEDQYYTGEESQPEPTVKYNGTQLVKGTDYTVRYSNNCNVGDATVTIEGKGNYTGTREQTFKINAADISVAEVTGIEDQYYTGEEIKLEPIVKYNGTQLVKGTDYTVSYENNVSEGTASVIVTGIGNYAGKQTKNFQILQSVIEEKQLGDVNGDGEVDIADALMVSRYDAGLTDFDQEQKIIADVNQDGEADIADALMISRYDAGLIESFG